MNSNTQANIFRLLHSYICLGVTAKLPKSDIVLQNIITTKIK